MSTLPLLMSLADELDNINSRTFPDDFGLGFYPHRHYNRNPSLQLSLPADTEWLEQGRQTRTARKYYSTESPKISASPTTSTNHYQSVNNDTKINNSSEQNENKKEEEYDDDDEYCRSNEYCSSSSYDSRKCPSSVKVAVPAIDSQNRIINIKQSSESGINKQLFSVKETKKLNNNSRRNSRNFCGGSIVADEECTGIQKDGVKNKRRTQLDQNRK